jgi:hypothetical protein
MNFLVGLLILIGGLLFLTFLPLFFPLVILGLLIWFIIEIGKYVRTGKV